MALKTVRITRKGQVTIPKHIRDFLKSDLIGFDIIDNSVVVVPVESAAGSLSKYAKAHIPLENIRDTAWKETIDAKFGKKDS